MQSDIELAIEAARIAGRVIMGYYKDEYEIKEKGVDNPVTTADLAADEILKKTLLGARPDDGWLSEETQDSSDRLSRSRVWIVDPIDGTKEFINGIPQFAVSIALCVDGRGQVGVVYNPARDEMFSAVRGEGAMLNGEPVRVTERKVISGASILASRSEVARGEFERFTGDYNITPIGSIAYKLALVAAGKADLTFTLTPKNEWDFAAGALLVSEAGGKVHILGGHPQTYNSEDPLIKGLVSTNAHLFDEVMMLTGAK